MHALWAGEEARSEVTRGILTPDDLMGTQPSFAECRDGANFLIEVRQGP